MIQRMNKRMKMALVAMAAMVAAGCGQALARSGVAQDAVAVVGGGYQLMTAGGSLLPGHPILALGKRLGLTGAQKEALVAIARKHRAALAPGDLAARKAELRAILSAEAVDEARLRAFIGEAQARFEARRADRQAMAAAMREVLTPAQREKLAGLIAHGHPERSARFEAARKLVKGRLATRLGLTPGQQAAIEDLSDQVDALRAGGRIKAVRDAAAGFVRTGDPAALTAATTGISQDLPVDQLVAVAASLDQGQRQALVAHAEAMIAQRLLRHGLPR